MFHPSEARGFGGKWVSKGSNDKYKATVGGSHSMNLMSGEHYASSIKAKSVSKPGGTTTRNPVTGHNYNVPKSVKPTAKSGGSHTMNMFTGKNY